MSDTDYSQANAAWRDAQARIEAQATLIAELVEALDEVTSHLETFISDRYADHPTLKWLWGRRLVPCTIARAALAKAKAVQP
jgi:hypothetical protein